MDCKNPIKIGATLSINIARHNGDEPVDLTGVQIESMLRHTRFGSYEMDVEIIDAPLGQIKLVLSGDDTANLPAGDYSWDIKFTDPNGDIEIFPKDGNVILSFVKGATR